MKIPHASAMTSAHVK